MLNQSPNFFKQFIRHFKFCITENNPDLSNCKNFALCEHTEVSPYCIVQLPHFHLLLETSSVTSFSEQQKFLSVPCLYSTFKFLFAEFKDLEIVGETLLKLVTAVKFNQQNHSESDLFLTKNLNKRLPLSSFSKANFNCDITWTSCTISEMSTSADYVSKPARPKTGVGQKTLQNMKKNF